LIQYCSLTSIKFNFFRSDLSTSNFCMTAYLLTVSP
jgi:hypothetical protein